MKELKSIGIFLLSVPFILCACTEEDAPSDQYVNKPLAGFSWTGNDKPAPVTIHFVNLSENANQFEWDFGDGASSTSYEPEHTYQNTGIEPKNLLVVLKATDSYTGLYQRISRVIVIQPGGKK